MSNFTEFRGDIGLGYVSLCIYLYVSALIWHDSSSNYYIFYFTLFSVNTTFTLIILLLYGDEKPPYKSPNTLAIASAAALAASSSFPGGIVTSSFLASSISLQNFSPASLSPLNNVSTTILLGVSPSH